MLGFREHDSENLGQSPLRATANRTAPRRASESLTVRADWTLAEDVPLYTTGKFTVTLPENLEYKQD